MELAARKEEALIQLGPVLTNLFNDLFDPLIDDVFEFAMEAQILPPPPQELAGTDLKVEYVSILAQALQAVGAAAIERTVSFVGSLSAVYPNARHKIDELQAIDEYANIVGAPSRIIRPDDDVEAIIKGEQEAIAAQQQQANIAGAAQTAKVLSETDVASPNALAALVGA
jgi:hypothetical protein